MTGNFSLEPASTKRFDIISLFPEMFTALTQSGITRRAYEQKLYQLNIINPRQFTQDPHQTVDDRPYGGGPGMIMLIDPLKKAIEYSQNIHQQQFSRPSKVIYLSPRGRPANHELITQLVDEEGLILLCGRYEGIDQRVIDCCVDDEISIADFVVSGGELPAMLLLDAIIRLLPGALNDQLSAKQDSFVDGLLDCPHYTRPERYQLSAVPSVLLSGNHQAIQRWRLKQALGMTWKNRPDLLAKRQLNQEEIGLLAEFKQENGSLS